MEQPELYRRFSLGQFVIQEHVGAYFSAVAPDMKCEQTTQHSQKVPGGHYMDGSTWNTESVVEFELLFNEVVAIGNLSLRLNNARFLEHTECQIQHSLHVSKGHLQQKCAMLT